MARQPLSRKILGLGLLNLLLLAAVFLIFARSQFGLGRQSLLFGPARERILAIGNTFSVDYESSPPQTHEDLLAAYAKRYHADFFLVDPRGQAIAGQEVNLPDDVLDRLRGGAGRPPPPRRDDGPDDLGDRPLLPPPPRREVAPESVFTVISHEPTRYWVAARVPIPPRDQVRRPVILLVRSDSIFNSSLFFDWRLWLAVPLSVAAVCVLCWLPFIRSLTRSIAQMDAATAQIAHGRFDVQVMSRRNDELGHLGEQINHMSGRLQSFVKNQKRFLGDIAHELSAPIARIQFALGILEQKTEDAQRPHVTALYDEIQEMSALVSELLSFSKAGMSQVEAPLSPVNLAAVAQRAVARESVAATPLELNVPEDLSAVANEAFLLRALSNVVRNAVRYAGECGPIRITAARDGSQVVLTVADSGPGLPESELEEVFAPFYRPESARARETGGVGLGLAIVRTCIEACRGTVSCRNRKPDGLEVAIRLAAA